MHTDREWPLEIVGCPECGAPAEVVDRFTIQSTDRPVPHAKILCARRHWFLFPMEPAQRDEEPVVDTSHTPARPAGT